MTSLDALRSQMKQALDDSEQLSKAHFRDDYDNLIQAALDAVFSVLSPWAREQQQQLRDMQEELDRQNSTTHALNLAAKLRAAEAEIARLTAEAPKGRAGPATKCRSQWQCKRLTANAHGFCTYHADEAAAERPSPQTGDSKEFDHILSGDYYMPGHKDDV